MDEVQRTGPSVRRGRSKQDYGTPWEFIRACEKRFGPLVADLACTRENMKAPSGLFFGEHNSLIADWSGRFPTGVLWLNPPFDDIAQWAAKCTVEASMRHGLILFLTPASIGTDWFAEYVNRRAVVLGLSPRLTFEGADDPYPKDLMLSVYGYGLAGFDTWRWK